MSELLNEVLQWPIIAQGALGSGLFWVILIVGQRLITFISKYYVRHSDKRYRNQLYSELLKYIIVRDGPTEGAVYFGALLYQAVPKILHGLLWLTLGFTFQSFVPVFGIIGFIGAAYYFLLALNVFKPIDLEADPNERITEINKKIKASKKHNN